MIKNKEIARIMLMLILAILYFIVPWDLIPDALGRAGRLDDMALLLFVIWWNFFKPLYDEIFKKEAPQAEHEAQTPPESHADKALSADQACIILSVNENASIEEIKKAYYEKVKQYHPDKVDSLGPELKDLAGRKTTQLNEAYELLCRLKG